MSCENDLYVYVGWEDRERAEQLLREFSAAVWGSDTMLDQRRVLNQEAASTWESITEVSERIQGARLGDPDQWHPIEDVKLERDSARQRLVYRFTTMAPPMEIFTALGEKFPRLGLCLEYFSRSGGFSGGVHRFPPDHRQRRIEWRQDEYHGLRGG